MLVISPAIFASEKYISQFKNKITRISSFSSSINGIAGENQILTIELEKNGVVTGINTVKPINNKELIKSAIKIVQLASPYKPLHYDFSEETESIKIELVFTLSEQQNILISKASLISISNSK